MSRYQNSSFRSSGRYAKRSGDGFLHLVLFYILPFLLFNGILFYCVTARPKITLEIGDTKDYLSTEATLKISSWFPTKSVSLSMHGEELDLGKPEKRTYTIPIYKNGLLEANVANLNGMVSAQFLQVDILDDNPPTIEDAQISDGIVTVTVTDSQSGVDFDSIYAVNSEGTQLIPLTVDRETNTLSFEMDSAGLQVHAQDRAGNEVRGSFTSHKEGEKEMLEQSVEVDTENDEEDTAGLITAESDTTENEVQVTQ